MEELNLLIFLCEAFGQNKNIYKGIDALYQKHNYEFYRLAKESEWYNHPIITEGSLLQEEYSKKILGVFLYQSDHPDDTKLSIDIDNLVKKGWSYTFTFLNFSEISLTNFMERYIRKNGGIDNLSDDDINTNLTILLVLALSNGKNIIKDDFYNSVISSFATRLKHYELEKRINVNNLSIEDRKAIDNIKNMIFLSVGRVTNYMDLLKFISHSEQNEIISFLFDYENVTSSIFHDVKFSNKDIDEIVYLYYLFNKNIGNINVDDAVQFYFYSMYIKYLLKCYKQVKVHYFVNNKETQYAEIEEKDKEIKRLTIDLNNRELENLKLTEENEQLYKKIDKLNFEIQNEKAKISELNGLRELVFSLDAQIEYKEIYIDYTALKKVETVIIGGHERWQARMKELLPMCVFINTNMINFDLNILNSFDTVFFYVNYLNHSIYYRVIEYIKNKDININYINQQNEKLVLLDIQKKILS